jgi:hypothetical protein
MNIRLNYKKKKKVLVRNIDVSILTNVFLGRLLRFLTRETIYEHRQARLRILIFLKEKMLQFNVVRMV